MSDFAAYADKLDIQEQITRIDRAILEQAKFREEALKLAAERDKLAVEEQKLRIEELKLRAEERKLGRDHAVIPWQVVITVLGGAAACFAAGAAFVKLIGG